MSTELLFILGLVGLYLYDSAQLRFYNEFFISYGFGNKLNYGSLFPSIHFAKKFLSFPDVMFPHRLQFHCQWQLHTLNPQHIQLNQDIKHIHQYNKILQPLKYSTLLVMICTLIILPLALLLQSSYTVLAILTILIYGLHLLNSFYIFMQRRSLQLSKKFLSHLLLDTLLCPPFALNSLRKISLQLKLNSDAIDLSHALLNPQQQIKFNQELGDVMAQLRQHYSSTDPLYQTLIQRELMLKHKNSNNQNP
jgi:hypothetical protein